MTVILAGCVNIKLEGNARNTKKIIRVALIIPHNDFIYWTEVASGAEQAALDFAIDVKVMYPTLNYNIDQMSELIRQATTAKVDAIVVHGINNSSYISALEKARAANILVIFVDTDLPDFDRQLYVGSDNYDAGQQMGKELIASSGGKATVGIITGGEGYPNLDERLDGLRDAIAAFPGISIVRVEHDEFDILNVMQKYRDILKDERKIDTIVCLEGTGGFALSRNLKTDKDKAVRIMAFDLTNDTKTGLKSQIIDGVMTQQPYQMGYLAIEQLSLYEDTGSFAESEVYTDISYITAADLPALQEVGS